MPIPTAVQPPRQIWDLELTWPEPESQQTLIYLIVTNQTHYITRGSRMWDPTQWHPTVQSTGTTGAPGGGWFMECQVGGVPHGFPWAEGDVGGVVGTRRNLGMEGFHGRMSVDPLNAYALDAGVELFPSLRVWWLQILLRWEAGAGNPTQNAGLVVMPQNGAVTGWPGNAVGATNRGGMGVVGDGAGQWQHVSYNRTGILLQRYAMALPAHNLTDWNMADFLIFSQGPGGRNSYFEFWWNSSLVTTRDWRGTDLEGQNPNEWAWVPQVGLDDQGGVQWRAHLRVGKYDRSGVEV